MQNARCSAEQTQTVLREAPTITHLPGNCWLQRYLYLLKHVCLPSFHVLLLNPSKGALMACHGWIQLSGKEKSPQIDDGGSGFPPRDDDDGGGGGGGGGNWSGGFFFFGFLAFLGFLKDKESEDEGYGNQRRRW